MNTEIVAVGLIALAMMVLTLIFYGAIVLVVGYVILWLLKHFGVIALLSLV